MLSVRGENKLGRKHEKQWDIVYREFSLESEREAFLRMPPHKQQETRERVIRLLREEKKSRTVHHSYLWRTAWTVYGIDVESLF